MSAATLGVDAGGTLVATCPTDAWTWGTGGNKGYLTWTLDGNRTVQPDPETSLPVEATWQSETAGTVSIRIAVLTQATGCPYTDKRGGAWYVGDVDLHGANYDHLYDFDGSIGFRCACAPLVR
jgi:hypothetical protein